MCVERGKDSALHGSCHFCGGACFPGERPTVTDGTTNATDTVERYMMFHIVLFPLNQDWLLYIILLTLAY